MDIKNAWSKIGRFLSRCVESAVSWAVMLIARIFGGSDKALKKEMAQLCAERDEANLDIRLAVNGFLHAHPYLAPERFGVPPGRYAPEACFMAANGVSLLLRRNVADDWLNTTGPVVMDRFVLKVDGTACAIDGTVRIPATTTRGEVSGWIANEYVYGPDELSDNPVREELNRIMTVGLVHAQAYLRWLQAALRVQPNLIHGFRVTDAAKDGRSVTLTEDLSDDRRDPLFPWKTV